MTDDCLRGEPVVEELVLGQLTGLDRARALRHLDECHACRTEIATLTEVADAVLLLAPATTPDPGFEQRVLSRISQVTGTAPSSNSPSSARNKARPSRVRLAVAAAAVVAAVVAGVLGGSLAWNAQRTPSAVAAAMIDGRGQPVGRVSLLVQHDTAVQMDLPGWASLLTTYGDAAGGQYWLDITLDDGGEIRTPLPPGDAGDWRVNAPVSRSHIVAVAITDQDGHQWCRAQFT